MPVISESPSKVCPRCEPHLAAVAGSSSVEQGIPREPSFTRRRKLPNHEKQVTFTTDYEECGTSTAEDNKALKFKAGYRRVNHSAHPSSYQLNYSWKDPAPGHTHAPVIEAANQLQQQTGQPSKPSKIVVTSEHVQHPPCPVHSDTAPVGAKHQSQTEHDKKESVAPKTKKRPIVEPLTIPDYADTSNRESRIQSEPLRTRDTVGGRVKGSKSHTPTHNPQPASPIRGGGVKKRKKYSSPLKHLYESDYRRQGLAKTLFKTQYQMHYKDWLHEREAGAKQQSKPRKEQQPFAYGGPPVRTDPTDPRYLKHLPHPPLPHYPPELHWKTNYKAHFVEPSAFKYEQGVWKSPNSVVKDDHGLSSEKGAEPHPSGSENQQEQGVKPSRSWFDQLVELRNKADHYKWKSRRTNFDIHDMMQQDPQDEDRVQSSSTNTSTSVPPAAGSVSSSSSFFLRAASPKGGLSSGPNPHKGLEKHAAQNEPLEVEGIEDSDYEEEREGYSGNAAAVRVPSDVKCTCDSGEVKGRVPTPVLRNSASPTRHHLDRTTPSGNGLLLPSTTYSPTSPKFRRDMHGTAPVNPLSEEAVEHHIREAQKTKKPAREVVSSVPKHISASSSPHHAHCIPSGDLDAVAEHRSHSVAGGGRGGTQGGRVQGTVGTRGGRTHGDGARRGGKVESRVGRAETSVPGKRNMPSPHHVRKLNFDRPAPFKADLIRSHFAHPIRASTAPLLSCQTCGTSLQPSVPPPSSAPPVDGKPTPQLPYSATVNVPPPRSGSQPQYNSSQVKGVPQAVRKDGVISSHEYKSASRELFTSPTPNSHGEASVSPPTSPPYRQTRPKVPQLTQDLDSLSLSSMSMSSCSVASEILEKAKKRRDHFWTSQHQSRE